MVEKHRYAGVVPVVFVTALEEELSIVWTFSVHPHNATAKIRNIQKEVIRKKFFQGIHVLILYD